MSQSNGRYKTRWVKKGRRWGISDFAEQVKYLNDEIARRLPHASADAEEGHKVKVICDILNTVVEHALLRCGGEDSIEKHVAEVREREQKEANVV